MTEGDTHESPQFDLLEDDVEVFADLDSVIWVFDRAYTRYLRFCEINDSDDDFVTLLHSDARFEVIEVLEEFEVTISGNNAAQPNNSDEESTRQVRDERIELAETGEEFRRIVVNYPTLPRSGLLAPRLLRVGLPVSVSELASDVDTALTRAGVVCITFEYPVDSVWAQTVQNR